MPPAGMRFPPGIPMPYNQPIAASPSAATFPNLVLIRPESESQSSNLTPASTNAFVRKPTTATPWTNRNPGTVVRLQPPKPEIKPNDVSPKVVLRLVLFS